MQLAKIRANNKVNHFKCILANGLQQPSTECTHHLRENSRFSLATFACIFSSCSGKYSLFQIPFFVFGKLHIECVCVCVCAGSLLGLYLQLPKIICISLHYFKVALLCTICKCCPWNRCPEQLEQRLLE